MDREVPQEEAKTLATEMKFFGSIETSAQMGINVKEAFRLIVDETVRLMKVFLNLQRFRDFLKDQDST